MGLHDVAAYVADLLASDAPVAERTLVVCDRADEHVVKVWAQAVYGAGAVVAPLDRPADLPRKAADARRSPGKPMKTLVTFGTRNRVDSEDGMINIGGTLQDLGSLTVTGFSTVQHMGRLCRVSQLLEIANAWPDVVEIAAYTQRLSIALGTYPLNPARPSTPKDRQTAATALLAVLGRISGGQAGLDHFTALPRDPALLADRLKGAGAAIEVPFQWFGAAAASASIQAGASDLGTPVEALAPSDIIHTVERRRVAELVQKVSASGSGAAPPPDIKPIVEPRCSDGVVQRIVLRLTP
jgi:hypothetical protein